MVIKISSKILKIFWCKMIYSHSVNMLFITQALLLSYITSKALSWDLTNLILQVLILYPISYRITQLNLLESELERRVRNINTRGTIKLKLTRKQQIFPLLKLGDLDAL